MRTPTRRRLGAVASIAGLGLAVLGLAAHPAAAAGQLTCPQSGGWTKVNSSSSSDVLAGDSVLSWTSDVLTYDIDSGDIDICIKSGSDVTFTGTPPVTDAEPDGKVGVFNNLTGAGTIDPSKDISHVSYRIGECVDPEPEDDVNPCDPQLTGDITIEKDVTGQGAPENGTTFHFSVDCDDNAHDDNDVSVPANGAAVTAVQDADPGTVCRIRETSLQGAADVSFSGGTTGSDQTGDFTDVTVVSNSTVAVVATNTYRCVDDPEEPGDDCNPGCVSNCFVPGAPAPQAEAVDCAGPGGTPGILVTLRNAGTADAVFTVLADSVAVGDAETLTVTPAEGSETITLPQTEDSPVTVSISSGSFNSTVNLDGNCGEVEAVVVTPTPAPAPAAPVAEVEGVQQQRPAALARTGLTSGTTNALALAGVLLMLGGLSMAGSSFAAERKRLG